jgi:hypothetical protein
VGPVQLTEPTHPDYDAGLRNVLSPACGREQTFCPHKALASYYETGDARNAAWAFRAPFEEVARSADLVSFYPEKVTITIDGETLEPAPGQNVICHGPDRNLSVDELGGIQLVENAAAAET